MSKSKEHWRWKYHKRITNILRLLGYPAKKAGQVATDIIYKSMYENDPIFRD